MAKRKSLKELWIKYGSWTVWLFLISLPPQFIRNFTTGMYNSGAISTWVVLAIAYFAFGSYVLARKDYVVTVGQYTGGIFSLIIIAQYFIYPHAG